MSWFILGIDLGYDGFVCLKQVGSPRIKCIPVPVTSPPLLRSVTDEGDVNCEDYDVPSMIRITQAAAARSEGCCVAVMELPFFKGHKALVSLYRAQGYWAAACAAAGIPAFYIPAASWKSRIGLTDAIAHIKDKNARAEATKAEAIKMANQLACGTVFHSHDAAEAFLLTYSLENLYPERFGWLKDGN